MYPETIPGIDLVMACKLLSEIGDIKRFPNADKLAKFAGVAPVKISSSGKGGDFPSKQGSRRLQAIFLFSGDSDDTGVRKRDSKKRHLSGVLLETERKREVKPASVNLYCP